LRCGAGGGSPAGVRVNGIAPGSVQTDRVEALIQQGALDRAPLLARTPLRRFGRPAGIAGMACFLGSPAAA
jgi:NAD(P)-dependent dehydrogenase (short-subunit alcohol dehydrogenase family)